MKEPLSGMMLPSSTHLRALALLAAFFGVGFIGIQFLRPKLPNPPVLADLQAPPSVKLILKTSCYNCHSNETQLAWFDQIVPGYWLVVHDVRTARRHMNFSDFAKMPAARQRGFLYEAVNQIQFGQMPPAQYTLLHPGSIVSPAQLEVLKTYLHPGDENKPADPVQAAAADAEYQTWISRGGRPPSGVRPAPNGLAFFPDYRNWKPVSTTDRFDAGTMRVILGNDVTIRAIAENNIHPWPDGAGFAKVAWWQQPDGQGGLQTGKFFQVEFMIKDARKYAATEGWGFARWRGTDLAPYGKTSAFTDECTSCHAMMHENDFAFTMPIKDQAQPPGLFNRDAALPNDLPFPPFQWKVITSSVARQNGTMSTLYGNDIALSHARTSPQTPYPPGAMVSKVTWRQQEDRHWFGGRIPAQVQSVEFVTVTCTPDNKPAYSYQAYTGTPLQQTAVEAAQTQPRIDAILNQRAAVMP
jgi:hypothetical protein